MEKRKPTVATFRKMKKAGEKIVVLTTYDAPGAALAAAAVKRVTAGYPQQLK